MYWLISRRAERGALSGAQQRRKLRRAAGVVAGYAKIAGGFADTAFIAATTFGNWRNLRHFIRQPYPLGDMLVAQAR